MGKWYHWSLGRAWGGVWGNPPIEGTVWDRELLWPRHSVHGAIRKEKKAAEILGKKNPKPYLIRVGNKELM